jgi:uncharacterized protein (DUF2147 family)
MRGVLRAIGASVLFAGVATAAFAADEDVYGLWRNPENGSLIKLYACDGGLCAQITETKDPNAKDDKNPDPAKRGQSVKGLVIMSGAIKDGNKWKGQLYNREDGKTYTGNVILVSKDQVKLEGCVLAGLICKGVTWTRAGN